MDVKSYAEDSEIDKNNKQTLQRKIHVKGIPSSCTQKELLEAFAIFGEIERGFILYNHKNGSSRGFGFIEFKDSTVVDKVMGQEIIVAGTVVQVSMAVERSKGVGNYLLKKKPCTTKTNICESQVPIATSAEEDMLDQNPLPSRLSLQLAGVCSQMQPKERKDSSSDNSPAKQAISTLSVTPVRRGALTGNEEAGYVFRYDQFSEEASRETAPQSKCLPASPSKQESAVRSRLHDECTKSCHETDTEHHRVVKGTESRGSSSKDSSQDADVVLQPFKQRLTSLCWQGESLPRRQYRFRLDVHARHLSKLEGN